MAKNIEMNIKTESGYEILYPKSTPEQVGGTTQDWVENYVSSNYLNLSGGTMNGSINMGGQKISNVAVPSENTDVVIKEYVDGKISIVDNKINNPTPPDGFFNPIPWIVIKMIAPSLSSVSKSYDLPSGYKYLYFVPTYAKSGSSGEGSPYMVGNNVYCLYASSNGTYTESVGSISGSDTSVNLRAGENRGFEGIVFLQKST